MTYLGVRRPSVGGLALALLGGSLVYRGATGYCPINEAVGRDTTSGQSKGLQIARSVTINKPRAEVYAFWRQLENLPQFMKHLSQVTQLDQQRSHWEARIPGDMGTLKWDAIIVDEVATERIAWQSVPGATVDNAGEVFFKDAPGNRGTEVHATISYRPPAGELGKAAAKLFNGVFEQMIKEDIRRFKRLLETGEITTIEGQPAARKRDPLIADLTKF